MDDNNNGSYENSSEVQSMNNNDSNNIQEVDVKITDDTTICEFIYRDGVKIDLTCNDANSFKTAILKDILTIIGDKYKDINDQGLRTKKLHNDKKNIYKYKFVLNSNIVDILDVNIALDVNTWYINAVINKKTQHIYKIINNKNKFNIKSEDSTTINDHLITTYIKCEKILNIVKKTLPEESKSSSEENKSMAEESASTAKGSESSDKESELTDEDNESSAKQGELTVDGSELSDDKSSANPDGTPTGPSEPSTEKIAFIDRTANIPYLDKLSAHIKKTGRNKWMLAVSIFIAFVIIGVIIGVLLYMGKI